MKKYLITIILICCVLCLFAQAPFSTLYQDLLLRNPYITAIEEFHGSSGDWGTISPSGVNGGNYYHSSIVNAYTTDSIPIRERSAHPGFMILTMSNSAAQGYAVTGLDVTGGVMFDTSTWKMGIYFKTQPVNLANISLCIGAIQAIAVSNWAVIKIGGGTTNITLEVDSAGVKTTSTVAGAQFGKWQYFELEYFGSSNANDRLARFYLNKNLIFSKKGDFPEASQELDVSVALVETAASTQVSYAVIDYAYFYKISNRPKYAKD